MSEFEKYKTYGFYYPVLPSGHLLLGSKAAYKRKAKTCKMVEEYDHIVLVDNLFVLSLAAGNRMQHEVKDLPEYKSKRRRKNE